MTNIQSPAPRSNDRGQWIVATSFIIAVLLLGAVAVANVAIVSETEQAEGPQFQGQSLEGTLATATHEAGVALEQVNTDPDIATQGDRRDRAIEQTSHTLEAVDRALAFEGGTLEYDLLPQQGEDAIEGTRVTQNAASEFCPPSGGDCEGEWVIVDDAANLRGFVLDIDIDETNETTTPEDDDVFEVELTGTTDSGPATTTVEIYRTSTNELEVRYTTQGTTAACSIGGQDTIRLDLVDGTIAGNSCSEYPVFETISAVNMTNGEGAEGTFSLTAFEADLGDDLTTSPTAPETNEAGEPVAHPAIYALAYEVTVTTEQGTVSTPVVIAPGAPNDPLDRN